MAADAEPCVDPAKEEGVGWVRGEVVHFLGVMEWGRLVRSACIGDEFSHVVGEVAARAVRMVLVLGEGWVPGGEKGVHPGVFILRGVLSDGL